MEPRSAFAIVSQTVNTVKQTVSPLTPRSDTCVQPHFVLMAIRVAIKTAESRTSTRGGQIKESLCVRGVIGHRGAAVIPLH